MACNKNKSLGFTLIELCMVVVILGILAAVALPRFINLSSDARRAHALATAGAVQSAVNIIHAKWAINTSATSVTVGGASIPVNASGWPSAQIWDVVAWAPDLSSFGGVSQPGTGQVQFVFSGYTCGFLYNANTGSATAVTSSC